MASTHTDLRLVLVGKTGSGKSSTANTLLGSDVFGVSDSFDSGTTACVCKQSEVGDLKISVIDTPGLFDISKTNDQLVVEIKKCMKMSAPGPHVFLLVIRLDVRFTEEEKNTVKWIQENLGEEATKYIFTVFTHADHLKGKTLVEYVRQSKLVQELIDSCGGRFYSLNNVDIENCSQVTGLLEKIKKMVEENGAQHYTNELFEKAQEKIKHQNAIQTIMSYGKTALSLVGGGAAVIAVGPAVIAGTAGAFQAAVAAGLSKITVGAVTAGIASVASAWVRRPDSRRN